MLASDYISVPHRTMDPGPRGDLLGVFVSYFESSLSLLNLPELEGD